MTTLSEVVADIHRSKKTGLLSIAIRGDNNQFKIYFIDGDIYHLTCGNRQDVECLKNCGAYDFASCFFLPNFKLEAKKAVLPPTPDIIAVFASKSAPIELKQADGRAAQPAQSGAEVFGQFGKIREELTIALIRQIGPAGGKVLSKVIDEKWKVTAPGKADLKKLVGLLQQEIEDAENQKQFLKEAEKIIS
jgi:hypothetical protein